MASPRVVALFTDFGHTDVYAGVVRAQLKTMAPDAEVVDVCHEIPPGARDVAAFMLLSAVPFLPRGTIHLCIVDPGVGTERRIVAARAGGHTFVAPDNGVLAPVVEALGGLTDCRYLTNEKLQRKRRSTTFDGRDVMAPVVAHLVRGIHFAQVGDEATSIVELPGFAPAVEDGRVVGRVLHVDHFGNLVTNLVPADLGLDAGAPVAGAGGGWDIKVGERPIERWGQAFADAPVGGLLVYTGSVGFLEIAARDRSAADVLSLGAGALVELSRRAP